MPNKKWVILLHGLARSSISMTRIEYRLIKENYRVINVNYPSRETHIEQLANQAIGDALKQCGNDPVSFVTHSMGGILVRQYLSQHTIVNLDKVVMLGPPNEGSEVVDKLSRFPIFQLLNGEAGMQLGTKDNSVPKRLGAADFELGIIAGTQSVNILLSTLIPGKNDGKVSVESTKLSGMKDHIEVKTTHPMMTFNTDVINQVIRFLAYGNFKKN
ncbi:MAG: esterase/lipase family protein [Colwellia sp.]